MDSVEAATQITLELVRKLPALTGPDVDVKTVLSNQAALAGDCFETVYRAILKSFQHP